MAYVQSDKVNKKEKDYYAYLKEQDPGAFSSEYTDKAKAALADIENMEDFKYNPATDVGYQAARKQYTRGGQQAMKDTLGAATELTGGYDNSYAQAAAQQTYNQYMTELANLMPQYEQQAYGRYQDQRAGKIDYYGMLVDAEARARDEHERKVDRYNQNADRLYGEYMDAYNADYGAYQDAVAQDQWERTFAHNTAMDNASAAAAQRSAEADYYSALAEYEDAARGSAYSYAGDAFDDEGNVTGKVYYQDGKEKTYAVGLNPYTGTTNPDIENGAMENGYQPDNVNGRKLKPTQWESDDFGSLQPVWKTVEFARRGDIVRYYVWNESKNRYEEVEKPEE